MTLVVLYGTGNQLTDVGRGGESVLRVTIKSVEFDRGNTEVPVLYTCTHHNVTVSLPVSDPYSFDPDLAF
jgi:hypothetical protein